MNRERRQESVEDVKIWDLPTRLFHWVLVGLIGLSWYTASNDMLDVHEISGLAILTLILFRLLWGVFGSSTAQFRQFVKGPRAVRAYLNGFFSGVRLAWPGHNPAGGWVAIVIILAVAVQGVLGLFTDDAVLFSGPLSHLVSTDTAYAITEIHHAFFNILLALAILHLAAILVYKFYKKEGLTKPMVTGRKNLPAPAAAEARKLTFRSPWFAAALLALSASTIWAVVTFL